MFKITDKIEKLIIELRRGRNERETHLSILECRESSWKERWKSLPLFFPEKLIHGVKKEATACFFPFSQCLSLGEGKQFYIITSSRAGSFTFPSHAQNLRASSTKPRPNFSDKHWTKQAQRFFKGDFYSPISVKAWLENCSSWKIIKAKRPHCWRSTFKVFISLIVLELLCSSK